MNGSGVMACKCEHAFQDKNYGNKQRLASLKGTPNSPIGVCTVCGTESKTVKVI